MTAFAEFAQALSQEQLRAPHAYYSHRLGRFTAPTVTTFHNILTTLDYARTAPCAVAFQAKVRPRPLTNPPRNGSRLPHTSPVLHTITLADHDAKPSRTKNGRARSATIG